MGLLEEKKKDEEVKNEKSPIIAEEIVPKTTEKTEVKDNRPATNPAKIVDTETMEFTESLTFNYNNEIFKKKVGDLMKVSKPLRDILLARGCARIKPV